MKVYDLTMTLDKNTQIYPNDPQFKITRAMTIAEQGYNVSSINIGSHTGTHVDAPLHFIPNGASIDNIPLDRFYGNSIIFYVPIDENNELSLTSAQQENINIGDIVILCTQWSKKQYTNEFFTNPPVISKQLAFFLISKQIKSLGVDMPTIDSDGSVHKLLLESEILVFESLTNLDSLINMRGMFYGMPLKLENCDGSPVRACFFTDD